MTPTTPDTIRIPADWLRQLIRLGVTGSSADVAMYVRRLLRTARREAFPGAAAVLEQCIEEYQLQGSILRDDA